MEKLIKKFRDGNISSEELDILIKKVRNKEVPEELQGLLSEYWESSSAKADDFDVISNWTEILKKIPESPQVIKIPAANSGQSFSIIKTALKYAAIFLAAFCLSWFVNNWIKGKYFMEGDQFTKVEVSYGSKSRIELPDGSHVTLNSGSFIKYPNSFRRKGREVYFEGEAFFDVEKNANKPFIVRTSDVQINVLGTQFNVKAYPEEKNIETTLVRGKVEVFYKNIDSKKEEKIVLEPNHKLVIQKSITDTENSEQSSTTTLENIPTIEPPKMEYVPKPELLTLWKDNKLVFSNEPFEELITRFERWYDIIIVLRDPDIKSVRLTGHFEKETIEQALEALTLTVPFQYTIDKNIITINPTTN